jgi:hypothetical protein
VGPQSRKARKFSARGRIRTRTAGGEGLSDDPAGQARRRDTLTGGRPGHPLRDVVGDLDEIRAVEHLGGYCRRLTFADGLISDVDLAKEFAGHLGPVVEPLRDIEFFAEVEVDTELGTVVWPNEADFAPEVLHEQALGVA